ncbi:MULTISPECIES: hypothetical protein [Nocardia]|nr:hypothetical protein [Nocardia abscessus]
MSAEVHGSHALPDASSTAAPTAPRRPERAFPGLLDAVIAGARR